MVSAPLQWGEVLRQLTCKCRPARAIRYSVLSSLSPLQLGVCVKGGCEAVIHAASHLMSSSTPSQCWTLLLDFSNAFNSINREAMFVEIRRRSPTISAWMESCYSCQSFLLLGKDSIRSCCCVQQGDPLGPLDFASTLHPLIEKIKAELPGLTLNAWYLDDGTLMMALLRILLLLFTLWRGMALPLAFTSIGASLSSLSLRKLTRPSHLFHPTSPPPAVASLFWAAPLVPSTSAKRFFSPGW